MNPWLMVLLGWVSMATVMALLWLLQRRTGDAGIVDVAWAMGVGLLSVFFVYGSTAGDPTRRFVIALLALIWALRLSGYILWRVVTMPEDGRYRTLKRDWGAAAQAKLFRFYQFQAIGSVLFALPMLIAGRGTAPLGLFDFLGIGIWQIAISGEMIADWQLARFRANPANRGIVCRAGLWNYSRHPNYFFEWMHWWTYVCLAIAAPMGWITLFGPLLMLYFILYVTGIPPTEAQAIQTRGEEYRKYQRTTRAFFPGPPNLERAIT